MINVCINKLVTPVASVFGRFRSDLSVGVIVIAFTVGCLTSVSFAADIKPAMTAVELTEIVREPNIGAKATNVQVVGVGPEVTVLAQQEAANGDRDLKIDAVFLAKALFQKASGQITRVKVLFSQAGQDGRYVTISDKQITEYGSGKMTAEQFLSTLRLVPVEEEKAPDVVSGPQFERRLLVWQRIEKLRQQGTGVTPFETIFGEIETAVKSGNQDSGKKLTFLESKLAEQEEALKQAKRSARGLGVPASKLSSASGPSTDGSRPGGTESGGQGPGAGFPFVPPNAERLKEIFHSRADELISSVRDKDPKAAEQLIELKKNITAAFQKNAPGDAFRQLDRFHTIVLATIRVDMFAPGMGEGAPNGPGGGGNGGPGGQNGPGGGPGGGQNGPGGGPGGGPNGESGGNGRGPNLGPSSGSP